MGNTSMDQNALNALNAYQERNRQTRGEAVRDLMHKAEILNLEQQLLQKVVEENTALKAENERLKANRQDAGQDQGQRSR